jgi:hypothetical protein
MIASSQFSEDIVLGPTVEIVHSRDISMLRVNGCVRIPGDIFDIETDLISMSAFLEKELFESFGISWISLLWIPPYALAQKVSAFKSIAIVLIGVNGIANANLSIGNTWLRGTVGWKNDLFLWKDFMWIFSPEIGLKCSLPQKWISDGSFRLGVEFPAMLGTNDEFKKQIKQFNPRVSIEVDFLIMFAEIYLGGK